LPGSQAALGNPIGRKAALCAVRQSQVMRGTMPMNRKDLLARIWILDASKRMDNPRAVDYPVMG